jgi:hypothetical protein
MPSPDFFNLMSPIETLPAVCIIVSCLLSLFWPDGPWRRWVGALLLLFYGLICWGYLGEASSSGMRLLFASLGLLYQLKSTILFQFPASQLKTYSPVGKLLYLTLWPGMDPRPFEKRLEQALPEESGSRFVRGYVFCAIGAVMGILTALFQELLPVEAVSWLGLLSLLLFVHFGISDMLSCSFRLARWHVSPLFNQPLLSHSLHDFWSHRWNIAFVEMDTLLFFKPFRKWWGLSGALIGVFIVSGFLHELAISYPVGAGWGGPMAYFILHGLLVAWERKGLKIEKQWPLWGRRLWVWFWVLAPLPLLFHDAFRNTLIQPLFAGIRSTLTLLSLSQWFDLALWLAGIGNFCTTLAGIQVPKRLDWEHQLALLGRFNRKIFIVYYITTGLTILWFGALTLYLHQALMQGNPAALALSVMMGGFWCFRVVVDFTYFRHDDWPKGPEFVIGHTLLTSLFIALVGTYWGLVVWHLF